MAIRVNGELVSIRSVVIELTRLVNFYREHLPGEDLDENRDILIFKAKDQAIGARLLLAEAKKAGVRVSEDDVTARRAVLVAEAGGEASLTDIMDSQELDEVGFRQSIVDSLMIDKLVKALVSRIEGPPDAAVAEYLARLKREGRDVTAAQARDVLAHEQRGRVISQCVALLRKKAVIEDDEELDGPDIDAIFDSHLDDDEVE